MEFFSPETVEEAVALLARCGSNARVIAGGTDFVIDLKTGKTKPQAIISLGRISALRTISRTNGSVRIGATVNQNELLASPLIAELVPVLADSAAEFGAPAVREMATVGGNLVTASPGGDTSVALLAAGAEVELAGPEGMRQVAMTEWYTGSHRAALRPEEIVTGVRVPISVSPTASKFIKLGTRKALAVSVICVGVSLDLEHGLCRQARIALGAVAPTPRRAIDAEALLTGQAPTAEVIAAAAAKAGEAVPARDGRRASGWYRQRVTPVLVARALTAAAERR